jgi:Uncharacterized protein conserved in bacteria
MRILNLGGSYLVHALREQGHHVVSMGLSASCDRQLTHPITWASLERELDARGFQPDCAFWVDDGNLPSVLGLEAMPFPLLFYSIDTFCNPWHPPFSFAADAAFAAQKGFVDLFHKLGRAPEWLPLFAPDALTAHADGSEPDRDIPVAFVGTLRPVNIPQRMPFLEAFKRLHPLFLKEGAYAPVFMRSRIVLNQTAAQEVNFRCFESMACGAALLTEEGPHALEELFTPGEHIMPPYHPGDAAGAAALCREWLGRPEKLAELALWGSKRVRERHLASHRAAFLVMCAAELIRDQAHEQRLASLEQRRSLLAVAYAILADELTGDSVRDHQGLYYKAFEALRG